MLFTKNEIEVALEAQDLTVDDLGRFVVWVNRNGFFMSTDVRLETLESELLSWIEAEAEAFYGEYESEADFADSFFTDNFLDGSSALSVPQWVVIDWQATWDSGLRFDFEFDRDEAGVGYVWRTN